MWQCDYVKPFWREFIDFMQIKLTMSNISKLDIYLGIENMLASMLIIIAKQYIFNCMRNDTSPLFKIYMNKVMYTKKMEERMYRKQKKSIMWYERWELLLD
jgi:hypothetical protein